MPRRVQLPARSSWLETNRGRSSRVTFTVPMWARSRISSTGGCNEKPAGMVDTLPPKSIIPLLNDYAEALVSAIHQQGGHVLKFIGDGVLATFETGDTVEDC